jgi:hypothetical protein
MFAGLLVGMAGWSSKRCALTWKIQGTPSNRIYYQLEVSALPTGAIGFGLLPTVKTLDHHKQRKLDANGENRSQTTGTKYGVHLTQMAKAGLLPTPNACDWNTARSPEALARAKEKHGSALQDTLRQRAGQGSQLNPRFVAEMMGFPVNWTELPFLSGEQKA